MITGQKNGTQSRVDNAKTTNAADFGWWRTKSVTLLASVDNSMVRLTLSLCSGLGASDKSQSSKQSFDSNNESLRRAYR